MLKKKKGTDGQKKERGTRERNDKDVCPATEREKEVVLQVYSKGGTKAGGQKRESFPRKGPLVENLGQGKKPLLSERKKRKPRIGRVTARSRGGGHWDRRKGLNGP